MTATLDGVTKKTKPEPTAEQLAAEELVRRAREQGLSLTGPGRVTQAADQNGAGDGAEPGADRAPGPSEERHAGPGDGERAQRQPAQDGADRGQWPGPDRGAAGPGRHVRAADRAQAAAAAFRRR